ncbi:MAG TPA: hypothetical protein VGN57_17710 [Pirellulaceae bacterium]|nr:hypothetical protein [Pirellulaceae bacterium]
MSRRPVRRATGGMSLFPFLAVLICTMGALVGLLMLMIASASAQAASVRVAIDEHLAAEDVDAAPAVVGPTFENETDPEKAYQAQIAIEDAAWRKDMLLKQREELTRQLSERRGEVGYLEQTLRTLRSQADGLLAQAKALQENDGDAGSLKKELAELERRIAEESAKLEAAKAAQAAAPTSYAITPYDGPTGTHRRPMFIECTGEAVILQPEGIVLSQQDFAGPLFPGNPLDAALRAAQEYLQTHGGESVHGSAYPLFIVREEGAVAYSVARGSMKSWENEFGYELIPNDMKLAFPPVDPGLAAAMQQAVDDARQRQLALAAAQPSRFAGANGGGRVLHATPRGGFIAAGGGPPSGKSGKAFGPGSPDKPIEDSSGTGTEGPTNAKNISEEQSKSPGAKPGSTAGSGGAQRKNAQDENRPISEKEGEGWAVPEADALTTPLERPIRVAIEADRILIVAETLSGKESTQIALTPRTSDAIGPLVGGVQERIKSWGFAGRGFYWRPRMVVEVRPGGERRFAEISRLLENSGIVLEAAKP